ncbi:MAG TPA: YceI family protein [Chitinophagaceae bacterium]
MTRTQRFGILSMFMVLFTTMLSFSTKGLLNDIKYHSQNLSIVISGTSTLHDWDMKSSKGTASANFDIAGDKLTGVSGLSFSMPAESLKSEHDMMDKNAYKALKTGSAKNITFVQTSATVTPVDATTYQLKIAGNLSIAGNTKATDLVATAKYNAADKSFTVSGSKKFKMSEYGVKPPTVMMGTIKTGDPITVTFNSKIVR